MKISKHILYIGDEDDYVFFHNAVSELSAHISVKYEPASFTSIELFADAVTKRTPIPVFIIIDVDEPRLSEEELAGHIRSIKRARQIPVLFLSNNPGDWNIRFWEAQGVTILSKPRTVNEYTTIAKTIVYSMINPLLDNPETSAGD